MSIRLKGAAVAALLMAGTSMAVAQMSGPGGGPGSRGGEGYGSGMMYGHDGHYGSWYGRSGKKFIGARLDGLRQELKITDPQRDAWDAYAKTVTDAQQGVWTAMRSMMRPGSMYSLTPDQRFAFMQNVIELHKKSFEVMKHAADALMPHLTPYQKGQASVLLPGLSGTGLGAGMGFGRGGFGPGMMGDYGGGYGPGMMGYGQ